MKRYSSLFLMKAFAHKLQLVADKNKNSESEYFSHGLNKIFPII